MLEIFALIFLSKRVKKIALQKGEPTTKWVVIQIVSWFLVEFLVLFSIIIAFGEDAMLAAIIPALLAAGSTHFIILYFLNNFSDKEDIESLDEFALKEDHFR